MTDPLLSIRLFTIDHYQLETESEIYPVIRVFGSTPDGIKTCLHIHSLYPYLYIPYPYTSSEGSDKFISNLQNKLIDGMNCKSLSLIKGIQLVKAIPFYGFHSGYKLFLKLYMRYPYMKAKVIEYLSQTGIDGKRYQVYNGHLPFHFQFMIDFNLYGMEYIHLSKFYKRKSVKDAGIMDDDLISPFQKTSMCQLECDVWPMDIMNRSLVKERPYQALVSLDSPISTSMPQLVPSLASIWKDEINRRDALGLPSLDQVPNSQERNPPDKSMEFTLQLQNVIQKRRMECKESISIQGNVFSRYVNDGIQTAFQSITFYCQEERLSQESRNGFISTQVVDCPLDTFDLMDDMEDLSEIDQTELVDTGEPFVDPFDNPEDDALIANLSTPQQHQVNENVYSQSQGSIYDLGSDFDLSSAPSGSQNDYKRKRIPQNDGIHDDESSENSDDEITCSLPPMWSPQPSPSKQEECLSFFNDPPIPTSPSMSLKDYKTCAKDNVNLWKYNSTPPSKMDIHSSLHPKIIYTAPYESEKFKSLQNKKRIYRNLKNTTWEWCKLPPTSSSLQWDSSTNQATSTQGNASQIQGPTPINSHGFLLSPVHAKSMVKYHVRLLSVEVFCESSPDKLPDPTKDSINCLFYTLFDQDANDLGNGIRPGLIVGMIGIQDSLDIKRAGLAGYHLETVKDETHLFIRLLKLVQKWDPDILVGYELSQSSWGYLTERANILHIDLCGSLSRIHDSTSRSTSKREENEYSAKKQTALSTTGRLFINIWRLMRREINLTSYTIENMVFHILHQRIPKYTQSVLLNWYHSGLLKRWKTLNYFLKRVQFNILLLYAIDFVGKTSEFARVFGIEFHAVLMRGSQYNVESMMFRVAFPENFIMLSPSPTLVREMRAIECLPLVQEPETKLYNSPVVVLDFQSLYPSIMIGYNYCYSTCLGRIKELGKKSLKLGVLKDYEIPLSELIELKDHVIISPNGIVYLKSHIRQGVLGRMLNEVLETRIMIKQSMKLYKDNKSLLRTLEARQLGLKLLANTTYGYTGASFSGRMPCSDIADSIVQTGRCTLERGIQNIESTRWNNTKAKFIYGDTDSLFILLNGSSKESAFDIGNAMANQITQINPTPVKLKFEKVYLPCVLLAKKRYVGYKYETIQDIDPIFDAKGIETVRRDGFPALQKMMEKSLKILFNTMDISLVKEYITNQWIKMQTNQVSIQDFIIAKEVCLNDYTVLPPGALISVEQMKLDPRNEPLYKERVPYLIAYKEHDLTLKNCVVSVQEFLSNPSMRLNVKYYIEKQIIPPLKRIFDLIGVNVSTWYQEMPKIYKIHEITSSQQSLVHSHAIHQNYNNHQTRKIKRIDEFKGFQALSCLVCNRESTQEICLYCQSQLPNTIAILQYRIQSNESKYQNLETICQSCSQFNNLLESSVPCVSLDCSIMYSKQKAKQRLKLGSKYWKALSNIQEKEFN